ncbi:putative kinesin [Leptomonas seymouri]|uniref:Putative kinesin n=1 Tax=Leptomonas seymouri TaxID=5684 RepID=A0A0N1HRC5_LEPSE|nr:putative kinesin [Leptomonas seymouri]|eukprot:KPI82810.1 putative kinesin [Leptomonas seymouri]
MTHTNTALKDAEEYPGDGHIFVCVRVRDVPHNAACLTNSSSSGNSGTRTSTVTRKSAVRDAERICVSMVENVVVMHDPKTLDDASTVAKDGNNVVQMLTIRANRTNAGARPSRKTIGGDAASGVANTRTSSRRTTNGVGGGRACAAGSFLVPTGTANYYECDHCIASMEQSQLMQMPLIRTSDFLQPPPYGSQEEVYRRTAMHAVRAAVEGINSCVFAYGQTGSGKTYTLFGDTTNIRHDPGTVPRSLDDLFGQLEAIRESYRGNEETDYAYSVQISFFEIYQNEVFCLFSRQGPLHVQFARDPAGKKETMTICDLQQQTVTSADKAYPLIEMGLRRRQTAETGMNARSSRSHAILQVRVAQYRTNRDTREVVEHQATINLVDLAGSERQKTANTDGKSRDEGIQINQSLATLARVMNDISSGAKFVNYRDSLLTMVLKDNLGGNSKTFMIANISPIAFSFAESCATLTYAKAVRRIRNRPVVNRTFQTRANLLEQNSRLKQENEKLKEQMEAWVRNLQNGGLAAGLNLEGAPTRRSMQQRADAVGGDSGGQLPASQWMTLVPQGLLHERVIADRPFSAEQLRVLSASQAAAGCNESFFSATSAGLTAPLLISSHRRYTSVAGIGGSCVEGGWVRVSALVQETMQFPLRRVLDPITSGATTATEVQDGGRAQALPSEAERHTATLMNADDDKDGAHGERRASASPDAVPTDFPQINILAQNDVGDLGVLQLDRVAQRSCEQRYYVSFLSPTSEDGIARLIDVQVNGKSIGTRSRRELHHGDVVCAYLEDGERSTEGLHAQSLISFHYVDLNALSRNTSGAAFGAATTLGQIAVSVDIPEGLENLTLEGIKQLQRDNAKLLDMVRQQAETIDFQCARASVSPASRANLMMGASPIGSLEAVSPDPRCLEPSPSAIMPLEPRTTIAVAEAFRRLSEPRGLRCGSVLPADIEADALLRRAAAQSESQQRLDGAMKENEKLHRTVVSRNATLDALAKRLAELEAGDVVRPTRSPSSGSSSASSGCNAALSVSSKASSACVSLSPSADRDGGAATLVCPRDVCNDEGQQRSAGEGGSMSCISSPSAARDAFDVSRSSKRTRGAAADGEGDSEVVEPIGDGKRRVVYENTEGARERYQAVVREREQFDRIVELEAIIDDLRERLTELESRLRFAKDETLEQQMLREQAEAEQAALLEELSDARRENSELRGDNASLEAFLAKDEQALADAARLAEEELDRRTSVLVDRIKALKTLARMWKQRTMKYIAMGYGAGEGNDAAHLDTIPWDDLRAAETVAIAKRRLGGTSSGGCSPTRDHDRGSAGSGCTAEMAQALEDFERDTAEENLRVLEYALLDFEHENQRLLGEIRRIQAELHRYKDLIDHLRAEKVDMERQLAHAATSSDEERRRVQKLLNNTNDQLAEAENNLKATQGRLDETMALCDNNKRKAAKNNELLLAQQKRTIEDLEAQLKRLRSDVTSKDEELRNLTRYVEDHDAMGGDGVVKSYELRSRIEEMVTDAVDDCGAPAGYSVFPTGYEFSDEMVALIRICLRILLDRLKMELYVLNSQSVHRFSLLIHSVKARTEAQFHTFMHQLRDAVSQMTGRMVRPGGKWGLSEANVLSNLVDHRRRQVGDALNGLLIWYDHWDSSPKTEHVAYMELIRNADRIMQMARIVRRESLLNTNATSTSLMPVPGKNGSSEKPLVVDGPKKKDKTVKDSCRILSRLNSSARQSNLARAVHQFSATPSHATIAAREDISAGGGGGGVEGTPFKRSATVTALALSQSTFPFSRTATGTRGSAHQQQQPRGSATLPLHADGTSPASGAQAESFPPLTRCPSGLPRPSATAAPSTAVSTSTPLRPTNSIACGATAAGHHTAGGSVAAGTLHQSSALSPSTRAAYARVASAGVLPVSDADVAYVASTDVVEAVSINSYNYSRRMSATSGETAGRCEPSSASTRKQGLFFSRSHTTIPQPRKQQPESARALRRLASAVPLKACVGGGGVEHTSHERPNATKVTDAFARSKTQYSSATVVPTPSLSRMTRKSCGLPGRDSLGSASRNSAGSPSVRGSIRNSTNPSAFYSTSIGCRQRGSGSGPRESQRRSSTLRSSGTRPPAAASFYNPATMQSLRERSTSDANRTGLAAAGGTSSADTKLASSKKYKQSKAVGTASTMLGRTDSSLPNKRKASAKAAPFQKTQTVPRFSGAMERPSSLENVPSTSSNVPRVPKLNFAGMAGNY